MQLSEMQPYSKWQGGDTLLHVTSFSLLNNTELFILFWPGCIDESTAASPEVIHALVVELCTIGVNFDGPWCTWIITGPATLHDLCPDESKVPNVTANLRHLGVLGDIFLHTHMRSGVGFEIWNEDIADWIYRNQVDRQWVSGVLTNYSDPRCMQTKWVNLLDLHVVGCLNMSQSFIFISELRMKTFLYSLIFLWWHPPTPYTSLTRYNLPPPGHLPKSSSLPGLSQWPLISSSPWRMTSDELTSP